MRDEPRLLEDSRDLILELEEAGAEYLIVGAHALAAHGIPRATGDFDVLVRPTRENAERVVRALRRFGAPLAAHGVTIDDFCRPGAVYQIGLPPRRIDVLTRISGVPFDEAWSTHIVVPLHGLELPVLGREALLKNKLATGREKDRIDAEALQKRGEP